MKTKTIITAILAVALVVSGFMFAKSCRATAELKKAKKDYAELKRVTEADHELMSVRLDELNKQIGHRDETIVKIESELAVKKLELSAAKKKYDDLVIAEPEQPELESQPLVINLRAQIGQLKGMVTLVQDIAGKQAAEIDELKVKVDLLKQVGDEWKGAYEREHALRLQAEGLFKLSERSRKANKTLARVALGIAGAGAVYGLLK